MPYKPNILVICGKNKRRSRTAEYLFKNDSRFHIRSAGLSSKSNRKISEQDLHWADLVMVMEQEHRAKIREIYSFLELPAIQVLDIEDEYDFLDEELIEILQVKMEETLKTVFKL